MHRHVNLNIWFKPNELSKSMDGRVGFEVKLFIHFMKTSSWKDENFEVISLLLSILLWNFNFLPKCLPVKISGSYHFAIMKIIFKQSFYPRTLHLLSYFFKSTFFKSPFSQLLQRVQYLIFVFFSCQMKFFLYFLQKINCIIMYFSNK